jgi:DNA-binding NtrC family response regulator
MGKKKSSKVLIVGDDCEFPEMVADKKNLLNCKSIRVKHCRKALQVASRHPSYFDLLITDIMNQKVHDEDFAEQFNKLSPMTDVIYMIPQSPKQK